MQSLIRFSSVLLVTTLLLLPDHARAEDQVIDPAPLCSNCGWFWYETKPIDEDEPTNALPSAENLWSMDSGNNKSAFGDNTFIVTGSCAS